ncbi:MAG: M20/M25/M40 family metallo-hydrolase [Pseudomonadota bacterium]|nr:M20/M25/M40 family metallo-hydrolase [Pseudomonadota bacterium]
MIKDRLRRNLMELMQIPGLSGYEDRVRQRLTQKLDRLKIKTTVDRLGNLSANFPGIGPSIMVFTHMDQLGFVVRKIEPDGFLRVERVGGIPERALPSQAVLVCVEDGDDVKGLIANKSHHATSVAEKYNVVPYTNLYIDVGLASENEVKAAGIKVGCPVVYEPKAFNIGKDRIAGTSVDDRAGCAVALELANFLNKRSSGPPVQLVFSVQEEFNLRGVLPIAQQILPEIAIQLDLILATDTPDMLERGSVLMGHGPAISMFSFHGRGTLNGVIPHPAIVSLLEKTAEHLGINLQRSVHSGALTDLSYVQTVGKGVAAVDLGFPMRYSHSSLEVCDLNDLTALTKLLIGALDFIKNNFTLDRDKL